MDELKTETFFTECAELLTDMEERLLKLDEGSQDKEQLNAIFRCAHSIKGGSGAFRVLIPSCILPMSCGSAPRRAARQQTFCYARSHDDTLLKSRDIVTQMLDTIKAGGSPAPEFGNEVLAALQHCVQGSGGNAPRLASPAKISSSAPVEYCYHIQFSPYEELFSSGNDPALILREIRKLGHAEITPDISRIPALDEA